MSENLPVEESVRYKTMNAVLVNTVMQVFKEKLVRTDKSVVKYMNLYDYTASQLQFFLTKAVDSRRDLNSYIDVKEYLESFTTSSNLKMHPRMIKNYRKVFQWFLRDVTLLRYKALIQNNNQHFIEFVPTVPKILWNEEGSKDMRNRTLAFDFVEKDLKDISQDTFNCIVISNKTIDVFLEKISTGDIPVLSFLSDIINDKVPDIQEIVDFREVALTLKSSENKEKQRALAVTVLYNYLYQIELHALIEHKRGV